MPDAGLIPPLALSSRRQQVEDLAVVEQLHEPLEQHLRGLLQRPSVRRMSLSSSSRCNGSVGERSNSGIRCS
jgi:hypothetical protein